MKQGIKICVFFLSFLAYISYAAQIPGIKVIKKINAPINNPTHVAVIDNHNIAVAGANGFCLFNISKERDSYWRHMLGKIDDLIINKSKTKVGVSRRGCIYQYAITVHDIETPHICAEKYTDTPYAPITFNAENDNELITFYQSSSVSSINDNFISMHCKEMQEYAGPISCHPTECKISYMDHDYVIAQNGNSFYLRDYNTCTISEKRALKILERRYSPDGACIVSNNATEGCLIQKPNRKIELLCSNQPVSEDKPHYVSMEFFSNSILALLSHNKTIEYWDCATKKQLAATDVKELDTEFTTVVPVGKRLAFFPNGKILVALANKCFILDTPFNVLYMVKPDAQKQVFVWWVLKKYGTEKPEDESGIVVPNDIVKVICKTLIECMQYKG